jgi:hypothetical protein
MIKKKFKIKSLYGVLLVLIQIWWTPLTVCAQTEIPNSIHELKGLVLDLNSDERLFGVQISNLTSGANTQTTKDGQFEIPVRLNDLLEFRQYGYRTDTMIIVEFDFKRIYMSLRAETIRLDEVMVRGLSNQQLDLEIEKAEKEGEYLESSQHRGGLRISLSNAFGEKGKQARYRHKQLLQEKERRIIDRRFSAAAIQALTPLKGIDLEMFMTGFRPDQEFVLKSDEDAFKLYIMDSYAQFKKLSPEKKNELRLRIDTP